MNGPECAMIVYLAAQADMLAQTPIADDFGMCRMSFV